MMYLYLKHTWTIWGCTGLKICKLKIRDDKRVKKEQATQQSKHDNNGPDVLFPYIEPPTITAFWRITFQPMKQQSFGMPTLKLWTQTFMWPLFPHYTTTYYQLKVAKTYEFNYSQGPHASLFPI